MDHILKKIKTLLLPVTMRFFDWKVMLIIYFFGVLFFMFLFLWLFSVKN